MAARWRGCIGQGLESAASRRAALRALGGGTLGLLSGLGGLPREATPADAVAVPSQARADRRPNIIFILTDDMRADDLAAMPAVQQLLVRRGTSFTNFLAAAPACAPARASILRGQYPHNHGVLRGKGDVGGFARFFTQGHEQSTVATWLQEAGYRTALIGKYLNYYPYDESNPTGVTASYVPPGWDEWAGVTREAYDKLEVNENGQLTRYWGEREYATDVLAAKAVDFVTRAAASEQPFFLYLAPRAPHGPAMPAARHAAAFAGLTAPRPPSFNEADVTDKPARVQTSPVLSAAQIAALDQYHVARLQTLLAVDEMVKRLVHTLRQTGTLASTYILFTSDNGYHLGEHRASQEKGSPYEEAIRMPLVVRGPGAQPGRIIGALASHVDLAPTFAAWADAPVPDFVDGHSLAGLLRGRSAPAWRQTVLVEHFFERSDRSSAQPGFDVLRTERLTYVEHSTGERELYDLANDPHQLENLAAGANPALLHALSARLAAMTACTGETCWAVETMPLARG